MVINIDQNVEFIGWIKIKMIKRVFEHYKYFFVFLKV